MVDFVITETMVKEICNVLPIIGFLCLCGFLAYINKDKI